MGRGTAGHRDLGPELNRPDGTRSELADSWWAAVAVVTRVCGDLATAEDAVQEACLSALRQWPVTGRPADPQAWLVGVARHKAIDWVRREARRREKEAAAVRDWTRHEPPPSSGSPGEDQLSLIFMCCHPALDPAVRIALTLRSVCGLSTADVASVFLVPAATMAKRLTRARQKIREAGIPFGAVGADALADRLDAVLRVVYLVFTEGHKASGGADLVRGDLCDTAVDLARTVHSLLPAEPEPAGLLALLLLTDARRPARVDAAGDLILLADQDRRRWNQGMVAEGEQLIEWALRQGRPGPYQLHAAIAACHSTASHADATDWRQIALLYGELLGYEPTPVVAANRAIAVAMVDGPAAGLAILDALRDDGRLADWAPLHVARADLLRRLGRADQAVEAYRRALGLNPTGAEQSFIGRRLADLTAPAGRPPDQQ